jgi:ectoine hydroxylase-related dioxygenase (phytanoyl-CoA dioxygenase family)
MSGSMSGSMSAMHCKSSTKSTPWHCASCLGGHLPVYTCWVALGPVKASDGTLCFVPGSHLWSGFDRPTPRAAQVPREFTERLRRQKKGKKSMNDADDGVTWYSADYQPGDLVIFNVKTVHAASKNMSSNYRLSLDTRLVVVPGARTSGQPAVQRDCKRRKTETK